MTPRLRRVLAGLHTLAGLAVAPSAHAIEMEFYTWNAFEETVAGFQRVSLVLQDPGFLVFALIFAVLGTLVGLMLTAAKGVMGQQISPVSVLIPALIGVALFRGLVVPTGTLHVYDPVRNAYQAVGDVPDAIVLVAGVLNKIERGVVEIIETAAADPAAERSGSLRYGLVLNALNAQRQDTVLQRNIVQYFTDCGLPSVAVGYGAASLNEVLRNTTDLREQFREWRHPSLFTTMLTGVGDSKVVETCRDAWDTRIDPVLTDVAEFAGTREIICTKGGFDTTVAAQMARCESELISLQELYGIAAASSLPLLRSIQLAAGITDSMRSAEISVQQGALVNRQVMAEGFGAAEAMDRWIPKLRGFMTATVLGLVPLICLFLLTPVMGKALSLLAGLFLWLALWGVADAISLQMAADAAADAFDQIRRYGLSYDALMLSPEAAVQSLGVFGKARTMALMLATVLSYGLFSFGGYAFTSMAQAWQSDLQQAGEAAGRTAMLPEERGMLMSRLIGSTGPQAAVERSGFGGASIGAAMGDMRSAASGAALGAYVSNSVSGETRPGGASGVDTTPPSTAPSDTAPVGGAPTMGAMSLGAPGSAGAYVSDRLSGVGAVDGGEKVTPGGAGGVSTAPPSTAPPSTAPAESAPVGGAPSLGALALGVGSAPGADGARPDAPVTPGGAGGVNTAPPGTAPPETAPRSSEPAFGAAGDSGGIDGGAAGASVGARSPRFGSTTTSSVAATAEGGSPGPTLGEVTVSAPAPEPRARGSGPANVGDLFTTLGQADAGRLIAEYGATSDLAAERRMGVTQSVEENVRPRVDSQLFGNEGFRKTLDDVGLDGRDAGLQSGGLEAGSVVARDEMAANLGYADRSTEANITQSRFLDRGNLGTSAAVGNTDRAIRIEETTAVIRTAEAETISAREASDAVGTAQGQSRIIDARAVAGSIGKYGEDAMVEGRVVDTGFGVYRAEAFADAPGSSSDVQRATVRANVAGEIANAKVLTKIQDVIGEPGTMPGTISAATARAGADVPVSVSGEQKAALTSSLESAGVLTPQQGATLGEQDGVVVRLSFDDSGPTQATTYSGTTVNVRNGIVESDVESVDVVRSVSYTGGPQLLQDLGPAILRASDGAPAVNEFAEGERRALVSAIRDAVASYGVAINAESTESLQLSGQVGGQVGTPGGRMSPVSGGFSGSISGAETRSSGTSADGVIASAEEILDGARRETLDEFAARYPGTAPADWDQRRFASELAERVRSDVETAVRIARDGVASSLDSDGTIKDIRDALTEEESAAPATNGQAQPVRSPYRIGR